MPLSHAYRFIYIHIPKCAGKSLTKAFRAGGVELEFLGPALPAHKERYGIADLWLHHLPASTLKRAVPDEVWDTYFKFAFVRNPWDLLVSYYHYHKKEAAESEEFRQSWPRIAERFRRTSNFEEWVHTGIYVQPHLNFIADAEGRLMVDFVGRFETLRRDFQTVCERVGLRAQLPHENSTEHAPYREYYNETTRELVRRKFRRDIETFGYEF